MAPTCDAGPRWVCNADGRGGSTHPDVPSIRPASRAVPPDERDVRLLFCGDVVGRTGREAVHRHLPPLRRDLALDMVVLNGENAAHGVGLTERVAGEL